MNFDLINLVSFLLRPLQRYYIFFGLCYLVVSFGFFLKQTTDNVRDKNPSSFSPYRYTDEVWRVSHRGVEGVPSRCEGGTVGT